MTQSERSQAARHMRGSESGFTLLEVLVAVTILAAIMTSAFGALRVGARSWEAGVTRANETEALRTAADMLRRQFNQAIPLFWKEDDVERLAFVGEREQVRFIAPAPQRHGHAVLYEFTLSAQQDGDSKRLMLSYMPYDPGAVKFQKPGPTHRSILLENLNSISLAYFGINSEPVSRRRPGTPASDSPGWYPQWNSDAQQLPELIQLRLESSQPGEHWPILYLALHARHTK